MQARWSSLSRRGNLGLFAVLNERVPGDADTTTVELLY
jgi:hypothetical protein